MERVFITGRGLLTPIGRGLAENEAALRSGKSGTVRAQAFVERNLTSLVGGVIEGELSTPLLDRKKLRFCPPTGVMSLIAVCEALQEANIPLEMLPEMDIALISGVAGSNYREVFQETMNFCESGKVKATSPYVVPRVMPSAAVSNLSLALGIKGESYDLSAACSSSALCIIAAARLIRSGEYDIVIAGGAEQLDWVQGLGFCAIRALSTRYNDDPSRASRPFDKGRDGFVLAEGAGYVVLESERSIKRRGARPISEIAGFGANSNATDMVVPDAAATANVMLKALANAGLKPSDINYINTHGTATPVGDPIEMASIKSVFGSKAAINSTKSQTGHMVGATGSAEIIFSSLMLEKGFISPSINLEDPEDEFSWADIVRECREDDSLKYALSNSFAFGGSNASVILKKC